VTALVVRGTARQLPLPDSSVDLIVTSPPYYSLRAYQDGGRKYDGQIGAESTWQQYIHGLLDCTEEWIRVLKPTGSLFVNLGDKYNSAASNQNGTGRTSLQFPHTKMYRGARGRSETGVRSKSLLLLPERYRIAAVDRFGLICRAVIVWSKPNGLPESVTDRVRRSHEDWVHLVKQPRYYAAVDEIRESYQPDSVRRKTLYGASPGRDGLSALRDTGAANHGSNGVSSMGVGGSSVNPLGKLPGSVWTIATEPLRIPAELGINHFAAFPTAWPQRLILGWSPPGICVECGQGLRAVVRAEGLTQRQMLQQTGGSARHTVNGNGVDFKGGHTVWRSHFRTGDYVCGCVPPADSRRPAVVLDPFGGTGTAALVASALGRIGITVDLSHDYCRLARWRTTDEPHRAKVAAKLHKRQST
jgi:DNA modification methylase